jgi:glutathione S-transferase
MKLFDLAGADPERRFSPFCWRIRLALAHKGLAAETVPWRFTDKEAIAMTGQGRVPVLIDGDKVVFDSWSIAGYLEDAYPDRPSLFGGSGGRAAARFLNSWVDAALHPAISRLIVSDVPQHLADKDLAYFRASREERYGKKLEEVTADRDKEVVAFRALLEPLRVTLSAQPYLGGTAPNYTDYIAFGAFQWARCVSPFRLLADGDPIGAWRARLLDTHEGLARKAPGYDAAA